MSLEKRQSMEMEPESPVVEREVAGAQKDEDEEEVEIKLEAQKPPPYGARHGKVRQQPQVDAELVKQFLARYSQQDEHDPNDPEVHNGVVGTLNVPDCLAMIEANDVTFIVTDTGTGKSTLIPKALLEKGAIVASSQPRRTAAINLAHRVASLRNEKVGEAVGYRVRGEHAGDEKNMSPHVHDQLHSLAVRALTPGRPCVYALPYRRVSRAAARRRSDASFAACLPSCSPIRCPSRLSC